MTPTSEWRPNIKDAAGGSLIHFIKTIWALVVGWGLLGGAPMLLGIGIWRYRQVKRDLHRAKTGGRL